MNHPPLPDWFDKLRPSQESTISYVVDQFRRGSKVVLLDAPTGFGKTLTAEMVRRELNSKAIYLCTSKQLQRQFTHDFPYAQLLMGRSNYPTLDFADDFDHPYEPITAADCDKTSDGDGNTRCTYCSLVMDCPYERAKHQTLNAHLGCINTAYYLTESNGPGKFHLRFPLTIIDEADKLEGELLNYIQVSVSPRLIQRAGLSYPKFKTKQDSWVEWAQENAPIVRQYATSIRDNTPKAIKYRASVIQLARRLAKVAEEIALGGWVYEEGYNKSITFKPIRVTDWADDLLWRHGDRFLLMSGTLIPAEIISSLAPPSPVSTIEAPSSFPPSSRPINIVGTASMSKGEREDAWPRMGVAVGRIMALHPDERILVHTTTYSLANYLYSFLPQDRLITYTNSASKDYALTRYRSQPNSVLLAPSMDRGVDLPDDDCRVVVIPQISYPDLGDKQIQARLYEPGRRQDGQLWYSCNTIRTLIQQLGRGMRHENDSCVHYILDSRFYKLYNTWGRLIPQWVQDAFQWGGPWKEVINRGLK